MLIMVFVSFGTMYLDVNFGHKNNDLVFQHIPTGAILLTSYFHAIQEVLKIQGAQPCRDKFFIIIITDFNSTSAFLPVY